MMEKMFFKIFVFTVFAGGLLSSCLGDTESSYVSDSAFVYITNSEGYKVARTQIGEVTNENLIYDNTLRAGDCAIVRFKILTDKRMSNGIYQAEYFNIVEDKVYPESEHVYPVLELAFDTTKVDEEKYVPFNSLQYQYFSSGDYWGNCWLFTYTYKVKQAELDPELIVSYDTRGQYNNQLQPLEVGKATIDFQLRRQGSPVEEGEEQTRTKTVIVNMTGLRNKLAGWQSTAKDVELYYRFYKISSTDKRGYALSGPTPSGTGFYYLPEE